MGSWEDAFHTTAAMRSGSGLTREAAIGGVTGAAGAISCRIEEPHQPADILPGANSTIEAIRLSFRRVAISDVPVLLQGESGVGKEVLARQMHLHSRRAEKPFVKINCAALPSELLESELFGYERGAFTGAFKSTEGKFELANDGTLLLDEIGDMDIRLQAKLLHVLQDNEFLRLGGRKTVRVNVRVLAATHCDLEQAMEDGRFRQDLYYRLNVISIRIPPLRERKDEIPSLARFFMQKHGIPGAVEADLSPTLLGSFMEYDWPGNIRELENTIQRLLVLRDPEVLIRELARNRKLRSEEKPANGRRVLEERFELQAPEKGIQTSLFEQAERAMSDLEAQAIREALWTTRGNRKKAAGLLGVKYKALLYKMKKLGVEVPPE